jgi:hypothetical protein
MVMPMERSRSPGIMMIEIEFNQRWVVWDGVKDRTVESGRVHQRLQITHPNTTAEAVRALEDHDATRDVDNLEMAVQLDFPQPHRFNQVMEGRRGRGASRRDPIHTGIVGKVEYCYPLQGGRVFMPHLFQREF